MCKALKVSLQVFPLALTARYLSCSCRFTPRHEGPRFGGRGLLGPFRQFRGVPVTGAPVTAPAAATAAVSAGATSASTGTDALLVAVSLFFSLSLSFFLFLPSLLTTSVP